MCLADKASAPEKVMAMKINQTSIMFNWTAPRDTGRSKITLYYLNILRVNGNRTERRDAITPTLKYTFGNLQKDTNYAISVWAKNMAGLGLVKTAIFKTRKTQLLKPIGKMDDRRSTGCPKKVYIFSWVHR